LPSLRTFTVEFQGVGSSGRCHGYLAAVSTVLSDGRKLRPARGPSLQRLGFVGHLNAGAAFGLFERLLRHDFQLGCFRELPVTTTLIRIPLGQERR
jgi:hypothetical protein